MADDACALDDASAESAAQRVDFQLNYSRASEKREFSQGELTGPTIDCAYGSKTRQSGGWYQPDDHSYVETARPERWLIDRYAGYAIAEAVHEALEWFRVDGKPWLDPHGKHEGLIHEHVEKLADALATLACEQVQP